MTFPDSVQEDALVACSRFCCICHRFAGTHIQIHHIVQKADGGSNDFDNAIPLCLDCHAEMGKTDSRHPGRKAYSSRELKMHRDNWYKLVADNTPVQPDMDAEAFRQQYKQLRNEANYTLSFYANIYTNYSGHPDEKHENLSDIFRDIGTKFKVLAEQERGDCPEVPCNAELMEVHKCFTGLSNNIIARENSGPRNRIDYIIKLAEQIKDILKIT